MLSSAWSSDNLVSIDSGGSPFEASNDAFNLPRLIPYGYKSEPDLGLPEPDYDEYEEETSTKTGPVVAPNHTNHYPTDLKIAITGNIQDHDYETKGNCITLGMMNFRLCIARTVSKHNLVLQWIVLGLVAIAYNVYLGFAIHHSWEKETNYCGGVRFLAIVTALVYIGMFYFCVVKRFFGKILYRHCLKPVARGVEKLYSYRVVTWISYMAVLSAFLIFIILDTVDDRSRLISLLGLCVLLLLGFIFSKHPHRVVWRTVFWGVGTQFVFGLLILRWDVGKAIFQCVGDKVSTFLGFTSAGSSFIFGYLVSGHFNATVNGSDFILTNLSTTNHIVSQVFTIPTVFAFSVLPVIIFFSFVISILYYYGVMQWIVLKIGWLLMVSVGTTAAESMNAAANIFIGQTEAPLLIRPYLPLMTKSELHAVMTGGFATIAGAVMAAYINLGVDASHLLSASVMSAPAALAYSKLFYPESEVSKTTVKDINIQKGNEKTALEAAANGAVNAVPLVANIAVNLVAFMAGIAFINAMLSWTFGLVGWDFITFEWLLSKLFIPLAWLLGVDWSECDKVGQLIGLKTVVNEFVGYTKLVEFKQTNALSRRATIISTYALCGFSNISSLGIQLGGLGAMAPECKSALAEVGFRALLAGSAACFMTACIAGLLTS